MVFLGTMASGEKIGTMYRRITGQRHDLLDTDLQKVDGFDMMGVVAEDKHGGQHVKCNKGSYYFGEIELETTSTWFRTHRISKEDYKRMCAKLHTHPDLH